MVLKYLKYIVLTIFCPEMYEIYQEKQCYGPVMIEL